MPRKPKAFVVMPFDPEFNAIFRDLIEPALVDAGYAVSRADQSLDQHNILQDIVVGIAEADLVVADLTSVNPNVFYELGLSHGLRVPTVLLTQSMDEVPFDLRSYRIVVYSARFDEAPDLRRKLSEIARKRACGEASFSSPIIDFLPQQVVSHEHDWKGTPKEDAEVVSVKPDEEKGLLDFILEGNAAAETIGTSLSEIAEETKAIGGRLNTHTSELQALGDGSAPGTATKAFRIMLEVSSDMSSYTREVTERLPALEDGIDVLVESYSGYGDLLQTGDAAAKQLGEFRTNIASLLQAAERGLQGVRSYRDSVGDLRRKRISRAVSREADRLAQALDRVIAVLEKVEAFCRKLLTALEEKLGSLEGT